MKKYIQLLLTLTFTPIALSSTANQNELPQSIAPATANVYIISPKDGETVELSLIHI